MKKFVAIVTCFLLVPAVLLADGSNNTGSGLQNEELGGQSIYIPGMNAREARFFARAAKKNKGGKKGGINSRAISDQCSQITNANFLIKADTSHHIGGGDPRIGQYSIIGSRSNCRPCSGVCSILFSDGTEAGEVGYYGVWSTSHGGNGCSRYYGCTGGASCVSANSIISKARGKKGPYLYLKNGKTCYRWTASSRRVGST